MKKSLFFLSILISLFSGCISNAEEIQKADLNSDGKYDVIYHRHSKGSPVFLTEIIDQKTNVPDHQLYWSDDGRLLKSVDISKKNRQFIFYEKSHKKVKIDGKISWQSELDLQKTYPDPDVRRFIEPIITYTQDNTLIMTQTLKIDKPNQIVKTFILKNFKAIDEYAGPYKGSIVEMKN